jgi:hypothetical protein
VVERAWGGGLNHGHDAHDKKQEEAGPHGCCFALLLGFGSIDELGLQGLRTVRSVEVAVVRTVQVTRGS